MTTDFEPYERNALADLIAYLEGITRTDFAALDDATAAVAKRWHMVDVLLSRLLEQIDAGLSAAEILELAREWLYELEAKAHSRSLRKFTHELTAGAVQTRPVGQEPSKADQSKAKAPTASGQHHSLLVWAHCTAQLVLQLRVQAVPYKDRVQAGMLALNGLELSHSWTDRVTEQWCRHPMFNVIFVLGTGPLRNEVRHRVIEALGLTKLDDDSQRLWLGRHGLVPLKHQDPGVEELGHIWCEQVAALRHGADAPKDAPPPIPIRVWDVTRDVAAAFRCNAINGSHTGLMVLFEPSDDLSNSVLPGDEITGAEQSLSVTSVLRSAVGEQAGWFCYVEPLAAQPTPQ